MRPDMMIELLQQLKAYDNQISATNKNETSFFVRATNGYFDEDKETVELSLEAHEVRDLLTKKRIELADRIRASKLEV